MASGKSGKNLQAGAEPEAQVGSCKKGMNMRICSGFPFDGRAPAGTGRALEENVMDVKTPRRSNQAPTDLALGEVVPSPVGGSRAPLALSVRLSGSLPRVMKGWGCWQH